MINWALQPTYQYFYERLANLRPRATWAGWFNSRYELKAVAGLSDYDGTVCFLHAAGSGGFFPRSLLVAVLDHAFTGLDCRRVYCSPRECAVRWMPALGFKLDPDGVWELTRELYHQSAIRKSAPAA